MERDAPATAFGVLIPGGFEAMLAPG